MRRGTLLAEGGLRRAERRGGERGFTLSDLSRILCNTIISIFPQIDHITAITSGIFNETEVSFSTTIDIVALLGTIDKTARAEQRPCRKKLLHLISLCHTAYILPKPL